MKQRWKFAIVGAFSALALALAASPMGFSASADHSSPTWQSSDQWGNTEYGDYTVYNNIWGSGAGSQTISAVDQSHWWVDADHPDTGGIKSYPNASYTLGQQITQMPQVTSSVTWEGPAATGGVAYNAAYDVWGNGHEHEIMIWLASVGPVGPLGSYETTVDVGGHTFDYYRGNNGSNEVYSFIRTSNTNSATVDITGISRWLYDTGRIPDVRIDQIQFGYEITSSAGGHRFSTESYSLDIGGSQPTDPPSEPDDPTTTPGGGGDGDCAASIESVNDWGSAWQGSVTIHAGDQAVDGWDLSWNWPGGQEVSSAWNVDWSQSGSAFTASDVGWNARIEANSSQEVFGFVASGPAVDLEIGC
ncbi:GH12 family glycosyl hydrolase domain-containing protein [Glycomyces xiaoerkulensis]|uniref:GH12 family glycosyl hydrolase domain-containing protein n=1 Tax=Glycomyces xiaoerkulensis TaxID=2038139 RepID=UPI001300054B|nr:cellulose binding domain-containing protein [Glycomyces xiaoerkulensis]